MDQIAENWEELKKNVQKEFEITPISYNTWIEPLQYYKRDGKTVIISTSSNQMLEYVKKKFSDCFKVVISEFINEAIEVSFVSENEVLVILDEAYADEEYAIAIRKGNTDLLNAINNALDELKKDGTIDDIVDKYISSN